MTRYQIVVTITCLYHKLCYRKAKAMTIRSLNHLGKIISLNTSSVIRQKGESQNAFSNKRTFLSSWYAQSSFCLITFDFINLFRLQSWYTNNLKYKNQPKPSNGIAIFKTFSCSFSNFRRLWDTNIYIFRVLSAVLIKCCANRINSYSFGDFFKF